MRNAPPPPASRAPDDAGGVAAVTRALALMECFRAGDAALSLAELARRSGIHKTTVLRLARTLAASQYMVQTEDGQWRLGPATGWLGMRYQAAFDVNGIVEPTLHELVKASGESASFYVREGDIRACVARVEGPHSVRHHVRIGERLPLDRGAPGRVILAFSGMDGDVYEAIRRRGFHISRGEREPEVSSAAAPVFGLNWRLLGSVCISGPSSRLTMARLESLSKIVIRAANQLSYAIAGAKSVDTPPVVSKWHP